MTPPEEAPQAAEAAYRHLDAAHEALALARRRWDPDALAGRCPCGPPALRAAHEGVADAIRRVQGVLQPVP